MSSNNKPFSDEYIKLLANVLYPIGKVEIFEDDLDHSNHLGLKWELTCLERSPIGYNPNSTDERFKTISKQFGEKEHKLLKNELPPGSYIVYGEPPSAYGSGTPSEFPMKVLNSLGSAFNNIHPVEVVAYWKRVN